MGLALTGFHLHSVNYQKNYSYQARTRLDQGPPCSFPWQQPKDNPQPEAETAFPSHPRKIGREHCLAHETELNKMM